jgi:Zn finger protein HypA/HybF involved in hydrogenase expression
MGFQIKDKSDKEFFCRQCETFLEQQELVWGKCPNCDTDENVYLNDLLTDEEE